MWQTLELKVARHLESNDTFKLTKLDEVQNVIDESLSKLSEIQSNRYVKQLADQADDMSRRL